MRPNKYVRRETGRLIITSSVPSRSALVNALNACTITIAPSISSIHVINCDCT